MAIRIVIVAIFISFAMVFKTGIARAGTSGQVQDLVICKSPGKSTESVAGKSASAGKSVRTLRVYETNEKSESGESLDGCRATYSKTNSEQIVGTSRQIQQCQSILSGIQKNLEASNWSCRHVGTVAVLKTTAAASSEALSKNTSEGSSEFKSDSKAVEKSVVQ